MFTLNVELFWSLFVFGIRVRGPGRFCRSSSFFFHWPAELLTSFVKHHRSDVQKKQDDTRQSSNGLQSRSPPPNVITELQTGLDLRNNILPGNNPDGLASCYCKFPVVFSLPVSSAVRCRVLWRKTIGAGTRVRLGFPNARPVVSDERSEEFRRSVKESLSGPFQANRSDGIKPGIGIERKNKPTFRGNMYIYIKICTCFLIVFIITN